MVDLANPQPTKAQNPKKIYRRIVLFANLLVVLLLKFFVTPKLISLYTDLNIFQPAILTYGPYLAITVIAAFWIISETYGDREGSFLELNWNAVAIFILGLTVGLLVVSIISPIYSLTSQIR